MKTKKITKKLGINKRTISQLSQYQINNLRGGDVITGFYPTCPNSYTFQVTNNESATICP